MTRRRVAGAIAHRAIAGVAAGLVGAVLLAGCAVTEPPAAEPPAAGAARVPAASEPAEPTAAPSSAADTAPTTDPEPDEDDAPPAAPAAVLLTQRATGGDGDSWKDTAGVEYRLGLVNAPELDECFGPQATDRRRALLAGGFTAESYATDRFGRAVSEIRTAAGADLAVELARSGHVDDRYLEQFADENPALADRLRPVFAQARAAGAGLWGACGGAAEPPPPAAAAPAPAAAAAPADGCHPDYETCIPVKGDGSGRGEANDLDCGDIGKLVLIRVVGVDPYRLDGDDDDGRGCESYG